MVRCLFEPARHGALLATVFGNYAWQLGAQFDDEGLLTSFVNPWLRTLSEDLDALAVASDDAVDVISALNGKLLRLLSDADMVEQLRDIDLAVLRAAFRSVQISDQGSCGF